MKVIGILLALSLLIQLPAALAHPGAERSITRLDQLIQGNPQRQELFILRGGIASREGDWQRAQGDFERAQNLGDATEVDFEWGLLYYRRADYARARRAFSRYQLKYPRHELAMLYTARASRAMGDAEQALLDFLAYLTRAEAPHPGDILAAAKLQVVNRGNGVNEALDLLDRGMSRLGIQAQLQRYAIALELQRGEISLAVERCKTLETVLGSSPHWKLEMAQLLLLGHRESEALQLLDRAGVQLGQRRPTPARRALRRQIEELKVS